MNRDELADFLRTRRARLQPGEVGLPAGERRRTPGLRREEVAQLAGMSVDYYIRLEQGRGPRPSRQILNALARALMLTTDERNHLFHLAGETPAPVSGPRRDVPAGILNMLAALQDVPAYVLDAKYEILAWNPLAGALMGNLDSLAPRDRNMIRWMFSSSDLREHLSDEERGRFARASVLDLRAAAGRYPDNQCIRDLVAEMTACSPEFAALWTAHDVEIRRDQRKRLFHPVIGQIEVDCQVLDIPDRDQRLVVYAPVPGSRSHEALRELRLLSEI
ncbi:helix-turn-helix transcriptional regulator [Microtetraspora sp. NBRC 16547]|uniref:helix-turn-helix transcriptional regulator n=1 Tax=Microtetraspora sp. NBRC 16547 TaxID=3030993 RepID=UPI0024A229D6|nr:helix-turn-helix transcriptional regulator [Microtetraspora sp. NBRC 16547]GLX01620.1 transcriptional regulator [Microtetraspora sp. NBRC 16547]